MRRRSAAKAHLDNGSLREDTTATPTRVPDRSSQSVRYRGTPGQSTAQPPSATGDANFPERPDRTRHSLESERHADHSFADITRSHRLPSWCRPTRNVRHGGGSRIGSRDKLRDHNTEGSGSAPSRRNSDEYPPSSWRNDRNVGQERSNRRSPSSIAEYHVFGHERDEPTGERPPHERTPRPRSTSQTSDDEEEEEEEEDDDDSGADGSCCYHPHGVGVYLLIGVVLLIIVKAFVSIVWRPTETQDTSDFTQLETTNMPSYNDLAARLATLTDAFNIQTELNEVPVNINVAAERLNELHVDYCPVPHHIIPGNFLNQPLAHGPRGKGISELDAVSCDAINGLVVDIRKAKHETDDIQAELGAGVVLDVSLVESLRQKFQPSLSFSSSQDNIDLDTGLPKPHPVPFSQQQLELLTQVSDIVTATFARRRSHWERMRFEARRGEALLTQLSHQAAIAERQIQTQSKRLDEFCGGSYRRGTGAERIKNGIASVSLSLLFSDTKAKLHYCGQTKKHSRAMAFAIAHSVQEIEVQKAVFQLSSEFFGEMETFWQTLKTHAGEVEQRVLRERVRGGAQDAAVELASYVEHDLSRAFAQARRTEQVMRRKRDKMEALKMAKLGNGPFAQAYRREL